MNIRFVLSCVAFVLLAALCIIPRLSAPAIVTSTAPVTNPAPTSEQKFTIEKIVVNQGPREPKSQFAGLGRDPILGLDTGKEPGDTKDASAKWQIPTDDRAIIEIILKRIEDNPNKSFVSATERGTDKERGRAIAQVRRGTSWMLILNHDSITIFTVLGGRGYIGIMRDGLKKDPETKAVWDLLSTARRTDSGRFVQHAVTKKPETLRPQLKVEMIEPDEDGLIDKK